MNARHTVLAGLLALTWLLPRQADAAPPPPTPKALAGLYIHELEPALEQRDRDSIASERTALQQARAQSPAQLHSLVDELADRLSLLLAAGKSPEALTVGAAWLVQAEPDHWRALNLFGLLLQTFDRRLDAATVLEAALRRAPPDRINIVRLNLANTYLDLERPAAAKPLLDAALRVEPESRELWQAMATYCYTVGDRPCHQQALLKSARFGGYVQHREETAEAALDDKLGKPAANDRQTVSKLHAVAQSLPLTMVDVVEAEHPDIAAKLREKYLKLHGDERMTMPDFPQLIDTSSNRRWLEQQPLVETWLKVIGERQAEAIKDQYGIRDGASEAENQAAAQAAAMQQLQAQFQQTTALLKYAENMPGVDLGQLRSARAEMERQLGQHGIHTQASAATDSQAPPGYDSGSVFAVANYGAYLKITRAFERELDRLHREMMATLTNATAAYQAVRRPEDERHEQAMKDCQGQQGRCEAELRRHAQAINKLGDEHFRYYINDYLPRLQQVYRPLIEDYWAVSAIYIRNMNDPVVLEREYRRVRVRFTEYASRFAGGVGVGYQYIPVSEEDAQSLADAEDESKAKSPAAREKAEQEYLLFDAVAGWMEQNLVFAVGFDALSAKITVRSIEFEGSALGGNGNVKLDLVDMTIEQSNSLGFVHKQGFTVFGREAELEAKLEVNKVTRVWNLIDGKYRETYVPGVAKAEIKAKVDGLGSIGAEAERDAAGTAKIAVKASGIPHKPSDFAPEASLSAGYTREIPNFFNDDFGEGSTP